LPPRTFSRGDDDLNPDNPIIRPETAPKAAAVLVPIILRQPELTLLLTQRTTSLRSHSGQVSFPGGKLETPDEDPVEAALRETEEETGLARDFIETVGFLDGYATGTAFRVTPVVGLVRPGFQVVPEPREVSEVFEVPLRFLMDPANHLKHSRNWQGRLRHYYAMPYERHYIWGATAGMIKNLYDRLYGPA
jgi:8-oxo-dGTP pyrophosphatase MutT (NUDIX family)